MIGHKTVVITGSTRGLGFELAKQFLKRKYNVVLCGTKQETVDKAIKILRKRHNTSNVIGVKCDVSILSDVENLADYAIEHFGKIDFWINNAGVNQSFLPAWELSEAEIEFLLDTDLKGTIHGTNVAMRQMIRQGFGSIYNVEGMGSNDAFQSCFSLYGTAKRAVTYYTDAVANEIDKQNLPVIIGKLSPGIMITDFLTSSHGQQNTTVLNEKTKKVYNILGDYPDTIARFLVKELLKNKKNGRRINWLTNRKAAIRFMTSSFRKRTMIK